MAQKQQQRIKQGIKLTPQQILAVKLMGLQTVELEECIKNELDENPALEEGADCNEADGDDGGEPDDGFDEAADPADPADPLADPALGDYMTEDDVPEYKLAEINGREERREITPFNSEPSLAEYLLQQLQLSNLAEQDKKTGEYIIGNLDSDGYLRRNLEAVADDVAFQTGEEITAGRLLDVLLLIQDFDPPGVGARHLGECLSLQLKKRPQTPAVTLALKILNDYFDDFSRRRFDKIKKELEVDDGQIKAAAAEITSLNPKPGGNWDDSMYAVMNRITPDFTVETLNGEIILSLNRRGVPALHVSREYIDMLQVYSGNKANRTADRRDAILFVKQKIDAAQGFINAIKQRQETLQRTMLAIIRLQNDFFLNGDENKLHPMILKDVADRTGYDISTISRVSNSKYVQTNFGIYPLKYFFSEAAQTNSGETVSTRRIKQAIRDLVAAEDKQKPATDDDLTASMREKGYIIARRTVAKYRERLGIPVARMRKTV